MPPGPKLCQFRASHSSRAGWRNLPSMHTNTIGVSHPSTAARTSSKSSAAESVCPGSTKHEVKT
eukprot:1227303-Rhodomonas_salina.1